MTKLLAAAMLAVALVGCGGPLEDETLPGDPQAQQQALNVLQPGDQTGTATLKPLKTTADIVYGNPAPSAQEHFLYNPRPGGGCH